MKIENKRLTSIDGDENDKKSPSEKKLKSILKVSPMQKLSPK